MRVFVTGASGFVGSAIVKELLANGHTVLGMVRSDANAAAVAAAGAEVYRGDLDDLAGLRRGAEQCEGVIHTAFNHDFSQYVTNCEADRAAIAALADPLAGSGRPLVVSSGMLLRVVGRPGMEDDTPPPASEVPRAASEEASRAAAERGVRASAVRLSPTTHDAGDQGFAAMLINIARQKGVAAYVGDGSNRWPTVHRGDAARLYRLALEKGAAGAAYHAAGEEGVPMHEIAGLISRRLGVPTVSKTLEEAVEHFGWFGAIVGGDVPVSNALTRERLGWTPTGPGLLADMEAHYFG